MAVERVASATCAEPRHCDGQRGCTRLGMPPCWKWNAFGVTSELLAWARQQKADLWLSACGWVIGRAVSKV